MQMLGSKPSSGDDRPSEPKPNKQSPASDTPADFEDDIPF
jgi:hypothetical protein